jgi:hypothetical protein
MKNLLSILAAIATAALAHAQGDWVSLCDGKTLAGWTGADGAAPGAGWSVVDGAIHLNGKGGNLYSEKEYSSFELEWEWKLEAGGNNGVKYWVTKVGGKEWLGIEYQMIDDAKHPDGLRGGSHNTASIYDIFDSAKDKVLKPIGEWNSSRVVVKDGVIEHYLNGKLAAKADSKSPEWQEHIAKSKFKNKPGFAPGKGKLMLTDHGDKVWFKGLRIREL